MHSSTHISFITAEQIMECKGIIKYSISIQSEKIKQKKLIHVKLHVASIYLWVHLKKGAADPCTE